MTVNRIVDLYLGITLQDLIIDKMIYSTYMYEQQLIKGIDICGLDITLNSLSELQDYKTIKIEGIEKLSVTFSNLCKKIGMKFNHFGPVTCHLFIAQKHGPSFPMHSDPDKVLLYVVSGQKTIRFIHPGQNTKMPQTSTRILGPGDNLFIPKGVKHQAVNQEESVMLSFGLEDHILEKLNYDANSLCQDDRVVQS